MRVGLVTSGFPPQVGGIEAYVDRLARQLVAMGCDVDVLTQRPRGYAIQRDADDSGPTVDDSNVRLHEFADVTGTRRFPLALGLWKHLRHHGGSYDVIHAHNFHASPALAAAITTRRPLVFTPYYHGAGHTPAARLLHVPYDRIAERIFARSSFVLCISSAEAAAVRCDYPVVASRVHQVGIGVDSGSITRAIPFSVKRPVVLVTGRLEHYKRVDLAVEAFALCDPDVDLVIIGRGPQKEAISARARALGIDRRVQLLEHVDDVTLRRWQRTAAVALSLSTAESFGLGVAEAAIAGANVVASDIPAHREVAAMCAGAVEFVPIKAPTTDIAQTLRRSLATHRSVDRRCSFPTWHEVGGTIFDFYNKALVTSGM
jgi:glycosyltransferase involved in cell wall biosynthesis